MQSKCQRCSNTNQEEPRPIQMQESPQDDSDGDDTEDDQRSAAKQEEAKKDRQNQEYQLRDRNSIKPPSRYHDTCISVRDYKELESYEESITGIDADEWKEAMNDEINSLKKNLVIGESTQ